MLTSTTFFVFLWSVWWTVLSVRAISSPESFNIEDWFNFSETEIYQPDGNFLSSLDSSVPIEDESFLTEDSHGGLEVDDIDSFLFPPVQTLSNASIASDFCERRQASEAIFEEGSEESTTPTISMTGIQTRHHLHHQPLDEKLLDEDTLGSELAKRHIYENSDSWDDPERRLAIRRPDLGVAATNITVAAVGPSNITERSGRKRQKTSNFETAPVETLNFEDPEASGTDFPDNSTLPGLIRAVGYSLHRWFTSDSTSKETTLDEALTSNDSIAPSLPSSSGFNSSSSNLLLQPETRPISQDNLVAEVRGIYTGLAMVEAKCIEIHYNQREPSYNLVRSQPKLNHEQKVALAALHRTLLHENHDFFLAGDPPPSPSLASPISASRYAMPAPMWRHGIRSFVDLMRQCLPYSLDQMLAFIYLAYLIVKLLEETVPIHENTIRECLRDLGRYRMAINDNSIGYRRGWTRVVRHWYLKEADNALTTGGLHHYLAILARPKALQQLYCYLNSLHTACPGPFMSARESILILLNPCLDIETQERYRLPALDTSSVKPPSVLFANQSTPEIKEFISLLDNHIGRVSHNFIQDFEHVALPRLANVSNNIHQRIADFLSYDDLVQLSLTCHKLCDAYISARKLKGLHKRRRRQAMDFSIEQPPWSNSYYPEEWSTNAYDPDSDIDQWLVQAASNLTPSVLEFSDSYGTRSANASCVISDYSRHSQGTFQAHDEWQVSAMDQDQYSPEERLKDDELEFMVPSWNKMRQERVVWLGQHLAKLEWVINGDSLTNLNLRERIAMRKGEILRSMGTERVNRGRDDPEDLLQVHDAWEFDIPKISSPSTSHLPATPNLGTSTYFCTTCGRSFRRMCDLTKHSKYHTRDYHCSMPECKTRSFSRRQDLTRHEKSRHQIIYGSELHYCTHPECQEKNLSFSRRDNLLKHMKRKHGR